MNELADKVFRLERKLTKWLPKTDTSLLTSPKITTEQLDVWRKLCEFSQYRKEAFGSRENQLECESRGEVVKSHDPRFISACDWLVSIFLHETMPAAIKSKSDWLPKAKLSLSCVIDAAVDNDHGDIYGPAFLAEAVKATVYLIENNWD